MARSSWVPPKWYRYRSRASTLAKSAPWIESPRDRMEILSNAMAAVELHIARR